MEEWRSYTTLSSQEKRKDMETQSDSLRFISSPRGNELTQKAFEMITISTLQRKELEKMRKEMNPTEEKEEDWLNSLQSWKSKRNSTLERRKTMQTMCVDCIVSSPSYSSSTSIPLSMLSIDTSSSIDNPSLSLLHILLSPDSARDHIKSSLSDSIEKGRESGIGSSIFSPVGDSIYSPSSNYVLTNYYSHPSQPEKEKEKSELDQVLIQLQLLREKKEKGEEKDVPCRFTPPLSHSVGKTTWTDVNLDMDKKETSTVSATLHYSPKEIESITRIESSRIPSNESKKLEKGTIAHEKMKKTSRMVVDIGLDDPPSFSSHLRSSYRSSTLNPIIPPIPRSLSTPFPPSGDSSLSGGGMRMYGSLPRKKDNDYRVISVDEKRGPGKLSDFVPDADRGRNNRNGIIKGTRRDEEPLLIRNYNVHSISPIDTRSKYKTIDDFDRRPMKTVDAYSTLPSNWSTSVPTPSQGIGRSAQRVEEIMERKEREVEMSDGSIHLEINQKVSTEIITPLEWLSVTQRQKLATGGVKKSGVNLVRKEFASELQEKIMKKMEAEEKSGKEKKRIEEKGIKTVSSKKLCADCGQQLGNGSAMVIATIGLSFHIRCFRCSQCGSSLDGNGRDAEGREDAEVQLDGGRLKCIPCHNYSSLSYYHTHKE